MRQLLDSQLEVLVTGGYLYVPLWLDPSIAAELNSHPGGTPSPGPAVGPPTPPFRVTAGRSYLQAMSLPSLAATYQTIHPEAYEDLRRSCLGKFSQTPMEEEISPDRKLRTIIFEILPHFIKIKKGREPGKVGEGEVLEVIGRRIGMAPEYYRRAQRLYSPESLRERLHDLEEAPDPGGPPPEGLMTARDLRAWLHRVLAGQIIDQEKDALQRMLSEGEPSLARHWQYIALQLYLTDRGHLEIDGCGFFRLDHRGEYLIYKRTGEYALKDYYDRTYRFPDCRVAVATTSWLKPVVLERYKHPLLYRHKPGQEICIGQFTPAKAFTAQNVIQALEEGLSALYHGYNRRRRNGYHSLDRITEHHRSIDFADYIIPRDDPRIISGELEITNSYT
jgi:hypothetical protein